VTWHEHAFTVGMPLMAPGERLSEVELLKQLALFQWEAIAAMLGRPPSRIESELGDRLYGSVVSAELHLGRHSMESLGEDVRITVRNRLATFGGRFVEGLLVFDDRPVPESVLGSLASRRDLATLDAPWAYLTNAFVARGGSNTSLKIFKPVGMDDADAPRLTETPVGVVEQRRALEHGLIDGGGIRRCGRSCPAATSRSSTPSCRRVTSTAPGSSTSRASWR
jgi:probable biosynthetic protein (TIGR04098 family)